MWLSTAGFYAIMLGVAIPLLWINDVTRIVLTGLCGITFAIVLIATPYIMYDEAKRWKDKCDEEELEEYLYGLAQQIPETE